MLIVVTGASRGIGLEIVKRLAAAPGSLVLAVSRNPAAIRRNLTSVHNVLPVRADISTAKGISAVADQVRRLKMPLRIVVNNAGLLIKKEFSRIKRQDLSDSFNVNVFSPFLLVQKLLPLFDKKGSHVINISSMGGVQGSAKFSGMTAYSSSKGALCVLTECLAEELKPFKVSVNCLALGAVQTEMLAGAFPGYRAPLAAKDMAAFIEQFAVSGQKYFNGKIIPVSLSTP